MKKRFFLCTTMLWLPMTLQANPPTSQLLAQKQPLTSVYPTDLVLEAQPDWAGDLGGAVTRGYEMLKDSALDAGPANVRQSLAGPVACPGFEGPDASASGFSLAGSRAVSTTGPAGYLAIWRTEPGA